MNKYVKPNKVIKQIVIFGLILCMFSLNLNSIVAQEKEGIQSEIIEINVALFSNEFFYESGFDKIDIILEDYEWKVKDNHYKFKVDFVFDRDIFSGELTTENYDMILVPGGGGGDYLSVTKSFSNLYHVKKWRNNFFNFIEDGGGYFGICSGIIMPAGYDKEPQTFSEKIFKKSRINLSVFRLSGTTFALPILGQMNGLDITKTGASSYVSFSGWDEDTYLYCGVPLDVPIDRSHPIFNDLHTDTTRITWIGGPSLICIDNQSRDSQVIARFPEEEISENVSTKIHAWKYIGGVKGLIKGLFTSIKNKKSILSIPMDMALNAVDWENTNKIIEMNFSGKGFITSEEYPNENKARIVLSSGHPECKVWWGGHIEEKEDTDHNKLLDGFHHWVDITPAEDTPEDEIKYNNWLVRRLVAWAAKIPDEDLPPVFEPSEVYDLESIEQGSSMILNANVEPYYSNPWYLDLYYKFSTDNATWTDWIYYGRSIDRQSWEFYSPAAEGDGFYQFCSIRTIEQGAVIEKENFPPGPDTYCYIASR